MALTRLTKIDGGGISTTSDYRVGVITATKFVGPIEAENATFAGNVSIGGTLTYEDVTNIDSVGLITARDGIKVGTGITFEPNGQANFVGVVTFNNSSNANGIHLPTNKMLVLGSNYLYGNITNTGSQLRFQALNTYSFECWDGGGMSKWLGVTGPGGIVEIGGYSMGVSGSNKTPRIQLSGSSHLVRMYSSAPNSTTLTERFRLSQGGFNFTGLSTHTGNFDLDGDLDVDGHTNLDNVSVAGISTFGVSGISNPNNTGWATNSMINLYGSYGGGLSFNDNGNNGFQLLTTSSGVYFHIKNAAVGGTPKSSIRCVKDGAVELYHNGTEKIETTSTGINVTGNVVGDGLTIDGNSDLNGDLDVDGHTNLDHVSVAGFTTCSGGLKMINSAKLRFGTNNNTYIYYDAGSGVSHFQLTGGNLSIASNVSNSYEYMIRAHTNGRVELYYDGDEKIRTTDKGILVGTGVTIETNGQANFVGVVTATSSPSANMGLRNVSISTVSPSGGSDGDLWFTYVA